MNSPVRRQPDPVAVRAFERAVTKPNTNRRARQEAAKLMARIRALSANGGKR